MKFNNSEDLYLYFSDRFKMTKEIYIFFEDYFLQNKEVINLILSDENIYLYDLYFKEILSWEYDEIILKNGFIEWKSLEELLYSINDTKSELTPVLIFKYNEIDTTRWFHMHLRKDWNPFT